MVSGLQITYSCLVKTQKTAEFHYEMYYHGHHKSTKFPCHNQGHLFAMEVSSGEEYYIASDNTGTPLAVFSSNGQMIKQVIHRIYIWICPCFQLVTAVKIAIVVGCQVWKTAPGCSWGAFLFMKHGSDFFISRRLLH